MSDGTSATAASTIVKRYHRLLGAPTITPRIAGLRRALITALIR
jgi:hypothetical protein